MKTVKDMSDNKRFRKYPSSKRETGEMWASAEWCWGPGNKKSWIKLRYLVPSLL